MQFISFRELNPSTASTALIREKRSGASSRSTHHNHCGGSTSASGKLTGIDEGSCRRHDIACASSRERFGWGLIIQLRVHSHEPGPGDVGRLRRRQQFENLERVAEQLLARMRRTYSCFRPPREGALSLVDNDSENCLAELGLQGSSDVVAYGIESNRHVLETFLGYSYDQGLAKKVWKPEDIFVKSASPSFVI